MMPMRPQYKTCHSDTELRENEKLHQRSVFFWKLPKLSWVQRRTYFMEHVIMTVVQAAIINTVLR